MTTTQTTTQVTFWRVTDVKAKLALISSLVQRHFIKAERVLILAPNEAAAKYVDTLLWTHPPEGFLPHAVSDRPLNAAILITTVHQNLNQAQVLLNLCPDISAIANEVTQVYDLLDETDAVKNALAQQRKAKYEQAGFSVSLG